MKLLLCKNIEKLGIVGDIVDVLPGYGRNYLLPSGLATEPTQGNIRALADARKHAELERSRARAELAALAERMKDVEITIRARANETGMLYGSVGRKEIVTALAEDGYYLKEEQVALVHPIKQLDNTEVELKFGDDLRSSIKVWIVREKTDLEGEDEEGSGERIEKKEAGTEAGVDDDFIAE